MLTKKQIKNLHKLHDSMTKDSFFFQKNDNPNIIIKIDKIDDDKFTITPYDISSGTAKQEKTATVNETTMRNLVKRRYENIKISNINEVLDSVKDDYSENMNVKFGAKGVSSDGKEYVYSAPLWGNGAPQFCIEGTKNDGYVVSIEAVGRRSTPKELIKKFNNMAQAKQAIVEYVRSRKGKVDDSLCDKSRPVNEMPYRLYVDRGYGRWEFAGAFFDFKHMADKSEELQKQGYKVLVRTKDSKKVKDTASMREWNDFISKHYNSGNQWDEAMVARVVDLDEGAVNFDNLVKAIRSAGYTHFDGIRLYKSENEAMKMVEAKNPNIVAAMTGKDSVKDADKVFDIDWIDTYSRAQGYDKSIWRQTSSIKADDIHEALEKLAKSLPMGFGTANCLVVNAHTDGRTYQFSGKLNELLKKDLGDSVKDSTATEIMKEIKKAYPDIQIKVSSKQITPAADDRFTEFTFYNIDSRYVNAWYDFLKKLYKKYNKDDKRGWVERTSMAIYDSRKKTRDAIDLRVGITIDGDRVWGDDLIKAVQYQYGVSFKKAEEMIEAGQVSEWEAARAAKYYWLEDLPVKERLRVMKEWEAKNKGKYRDSKKMKDETLYTLIRVLDPTNPRDIKEAERNGRRLERYGRPVGKYKDPAGFIKYLYSSDKTVTLK